jgi:hypothetical protein
MPTVSDATFIPIRRLGLTPIVGNPGPQGRCLDVHGAFPFRFRGETAMPRKTVMA